MKKELEQDLARLKADAAGIKKGESNPNAPLSWWKKLLNRAKGAINIAKDVIDGKKS